MEIAKYLDAHPQALWYALGFGLLAVEAGLLGFASGALLFMGMGAVATGLLITVGVLSGAKIAAIATFSLLSLAFAAAFWRVFRRLQSQKFVPPPPSSDMIGLRFVLKQEIDPLHPGIERYSGIEWRVEPSPEEEVQTLPQGIQVEVVSLDSGVFRVRQVVKG